MNIGLKRGTVKIVQYDPSWTEYFQKKKKELLKVLDGGNLVSIEHVGSTSIPALPAKPIVDISVVVRNLKQAKKLIPKLEAFGYRFKTEDGPRRLFFAAGPEAKRTAHLHIAQLGSEYADEILAFRDHLLKDPALVHKYERLKVKLANSYPENRQEYTKAKEQFIKKVISISRTSKDWGEL